MLSTGSRSDVIGIHSSHGFTVTANRGSGVVYRFDPGVNVKDWRTTDMRIAMRCMVVVGFMLPTSVFGGQLPKQFTLSELVPSDAWLYMNFVENPEHEWLYEQYEQLFNALKESGIDRDVIGLMSTVAEAASNGQGTTAGADMEATVEKLSGMFEKVDWDSLVHEMAYGMRVAKLPLPYDYFLVMRGKPGSAKANTDAIMNIVRELTGWSDMVSISEEEYPGIRAWRVGLAQQPNVPGGFDAGAYLYNKGDLIGVVIGSKPVFEEVVKLLGREPDSKSMANAETFNKALKDVAAPEEGVVFFNPNALMSGLSKMVNDAIDQQNAADDPQAAMVANAVKSAFDKLNVFEYVITSIETEGRQQKSHEVVRFRQDKIQGPFCKMLLDRKPFDKYDQFVPQDATSFNASGMIDLKAGYEMCVNFVKNDIPDGEAHIAQWNAILAQSGFNPEEDLFNWLSGEMISVQMPPTVVTSMASPDWVTMVRVKDAETARTKVFAAIDFMNGMMQQAMGPQGQGLMISPADSVKGEGFKEVTHPMVMMMGLRPVIGVKGDWLMIGSSAPALNKCLSVQAGEAPSIAKNPRFKREGLVPGRPVYSVSFTDTTKFGEEMAAVAGMVGMFGGMATAQIPDEDAKGMIQSMLSMVMKLGPVLQHLDFFSSESTIVTIDGPVMRTERVVTYKDAETLEAQAANN